MGGVAPLGYDMPTDPVTRALVPNEAEAATVRLIFQRYLDLGCVSRLRDDLIERNIRSKTRVTKAGRVMGGARFSRGALYHLLRNRIYLGDLKLSNGFREGAHPAIVPAELFEAVAQCLDRQAVDRSRNRTLQSAAMPLTGLLFDRDGHPMSPSFAYGRGGRPYRYYVSAPLQQGHRLSPSSGNLRRIPAGLIEEGLQRHLVQLMETGSDTPLAELVPSLARIDLDLRKVHLTLRKSLLPRHLQVRLVPHPADPALGQISLHLHCRIRGGRSFIQSASLPDGPARPDSALIGALLKAHAFAASLGWTDGVARSSPSVLPPANSYERRLTRLAFLAPDLQRAILEGRQPRHLTLKDLITRTIPGDWSAQRAMFANGTDREDLDARCRT